MLSDDLPSGWGKGCGRNQLGDSKDFDTDSHNIFLGKTAAHGLGRCTLCWFKNCLAGQAQRVSWKELHPAVGWPQMVFLKAQYWGQSCVASLLIIWTKELHSSPQKTLKWGSVDLLEGKKALQRDLDSCIGSQKYKVHIYSSVWVLPVTVSYQWQQPQELLGAKRSENSLAEKDWGVLFTAIKMRAKGMPRWP